MARLRQARNAWRVLNAHASSLSRFVDEAGEAEWQLVARVDELRKAQELRKARGGKH